MVGFKKEELFEIIQKKHVTSIVFSITKEENYRIA
ncbi:hypothetical protein SAMN05877753_101351 [Bacillus oleivorans]|uniref:Uncharacterized protein n=1 Tax=Bacillus oleivorans TaxID=1448271 RepID=A0A285CHF9_9BACI|nr:hypothetical protein SAMN05877753_101351 [Bacillus oleivorans]